VDVTAGAHPESGPEPAVEVPVAQSDSFETTYQRLGGRVLNLAYRMIGDEDTARDLAQEVWIKVYERFDTFEARSEISTWIHRITVNHVLSHMRRQRRARWLRILDRPLGDLLREGEAPPEFERSPAPGADHVMEMDERSRRVWEAVQTLDAKYRVPLVLHHYGEMSYQEVAETLQLSMAAVESRIHRARRQLIAVLRPLLDDL
jgi:RNA polymerase sigma-70 factor (ECF subfamily)